MATNTAREVTARRLELARLRIERLATRHAQEIREAQEEYRAAEIAHRMATDDLANWK